jgi:CRP-like cAMP-binding protein
MPRGENVVTVRRGPIAGDVVALMREKIWYLRKCHLLNSLPPERLNQIQSRCRLDRFAKGNPIYLPVDPAEAVYLVAKGRVKICHITNDGKQSVLAFVDPGEIFGELAVLDTGAREEYAEATRECTAIRIPRSQFVDLFREEPDFAMRLTQLIGHRRRRAERRLKNLVFLPNRERLLHLLLELAEKYGVASADGLELDTNLSHQDLASTIGSTRETVTLVLGELQARGLVRVGRRKITLVQPQALSQLVRRLPGQKQPALLGEVGTDIPPGWHVSHTR